MLSCLSLSHRWVNRCTNKSRSGEPFVLHWCTWITCIVLKCGKQVFGPLLCYDTFWAMLHAMSFSEWIAAILPSHKPVFGDTQSPAATSRPTTDFHPTHKEEETATRRWGYGGWAHHLHSTAVLSNGRWHLHGLALLSKGRWHLHSIALLSNGRLWHLHSTVPLSNGRWCSTRCNRKCRLYLCGLATCDLHLPRKSWVFQRRHCKVKRCLLVMWMSKHYSPVHITTHQYTLLILVTSTPVKYYSPVHRLLLTGTYITNQYQKCISASIHVQTLSML